jgi:hypothetical protein
MTLLYYCTKLINYNFFLLSVIQSDTIGRHLIRHVKFRSIGAFMTFNSRAKRRVSQRLLELFVMIYFATR